MYFLSIRAAPGTGDERQHLGYHLFGHGDRARAAARGVPEEAVIGQYVVVVLSTSRF